MKEQDVFYEYEQILLGKRKNYSSDIFSKSSPAGKEEIALQFFRCIMEKYLKWTPYEAYHNLNKDVMEKMKLIPLVRFIRFPPEFNPMEDCFYIVAKAYPQLFKIDEIKQTQIVYNRLLNKQISRFPKFFFEERDGRMRALYCLRYAIQEFCVFDTMEELYAYFAADGKTFLKKYKLWDAFRMNFGVYPVDYLHALFNEYDQADFSFLYSKYRVISEYNEMELAKKKRKKRKATPKTDVATENTISA